MTHALTPAHLLAGNTPAGNTPAGNTPAGDTPGTASHRQARQMLARQTLIQALEARPWDFGFVQLCRWMEARSPHLARIGEAAQPRSENLRLGQQPSTVFAPREIAAAAMERGRLRVRVFGLGLYGPGGPLPLHLTEEIYERSMQKRDTTLVDFLDMFHHRWLSLFYRAWAQGQAAAGLDRGDDERFSLYVAALIGHQSGVGRGARASSAGLLDVQDRLPDVKDRLSDYETGLSDVKAGLAGHETGLPDHARLAAAGHLVRHARNPAGVMATLEHYFGMPFRLEEYALQWLRLEGEDRARLGRRGPCGALGQGVVLGGHVPDRQSSVVLHAEPPSLSAYERLLPGGDWHLHLTRWLRAFSGLELRWELRLLLRAEKTPPCALGRGVRLGRTGWLPVRTPHIALPGRCAHI